MQQIYKRTPTLKCSLNKSTKQLSLQEINILPSFCSDHSLNLFAYNKSFQVALGRKFHNSLVQDETYILKMKENMKHDNASLNSNFKNNKHSEWEL